MPASRAFGPRRRGRGVHQQGEDPLYIPRLVDAEPVVAMIMLL